MPVAEEPSEEAKQIILRWWESHDPKSRYPKGVYHDMAREVDGLLADEDVQPDLIEVALRDWDGRNWPVRYLANCYTDAVKATRPQPLRVVAHRPSTKDARVAGVRPAFEEAFGPASGEDGWGGFSGFGQLAIAGGEGR